jgi:hypothetical protein
MTAYEILYQGTKLQTWVQACLWRCNIYTRYNIMNIYNSYVFGLETNKVSRSLLTVVPRYVKIQLLDSLQYLTAVTDCRQWQPPSKHLHKFVPGTVIPKRCQVIKADLPEVVTTADTLWPQTTFSARSASANGTASASRGRWHVSGLLPRPESRSQSYDF